MGIEGFEARRWVAAALLSFAVDAAAGVPPSLREIGTTVPGFSSVGIGRFAVADLDGDGGDEVFAPARSIATPLFAVIGGGQGGIRIKQVAIIDGTAPVGVAAHAVAGTPHVFVLDDAGTLHDYSGWPLAETGRIDLANAAGASAIAIGDIDGDGADEIVVARDDFSGDDLAAFDLATGAERWRLADRGGRDVLLEQLDADPALEIVVASTPGVIVDGATQAIDWSYKDGFGSYLAAGHFQDSGGAQFVAARDWDLFTVFQSAPYSPVWDASLFDIDAIAAADLDGDGHDDVIEGDGQWGGVNVYDGATHALRLSIPHDSWGMSALAAVDVAGNGMRDIAFSPIQADFSDSELFRIVDGRDGGTLFEVPYGEVPPFSTVAIGDASGNGRLDLLFASPGDGFYGGIVHEIDATSGASEWRSPPQGGVDDPFALVATALGVAARGGGAAPLIVIAGTNVYSGQITAVDGATHDVVWQAGGYFQGDMSDRYLTAMSLADVDGDGRSDITVCTEAADTGTSGVRLFQFSIDDGSQVWESVAMGSGFDHCVGVMAGHFDDGDHALVAAVLPTSIRAYDAATHLLAWTLPVAADGATLVESGVAGAEIAVFSGSSLAFYDGATRALLRSFDLGAPITAVGELDGVHHLLVAAGDRLELVDGGNGSVLDASRNLGGGLGDGNQIAVSGRGSTWLVGVGGDAGVYRFGVALGESIFGDGFDPAP